MDSATQTGSRSYRPALVLLCLSPLMAELITSSTPPQEFFQSFALLFMPVCYGFLAVLLREFAVRNRFSLWPRIVLALTMGLAIEGVICKSLFSPQWPDFSYPPGYDRLWGVNWCWALLLLSFHACQSFLLPWLATDLLLPQYRDTLSLTRRGAIWLGAVWCAAALFGFLFFPMNQTTKVIYHPGVIASLCAWGGLFAIPLLALRMDRWLKQRAGALADAQAGQQRGGQTGAEAETETAATLERKPLRLSAHLLGWAVALGIPLYHFLLPGYIVEQLHWPAWQLFLIIVSIAAGVLWLVYRLEGRLSPQCSFALLAGSQGFWVAGGLIAQLDNAKRVDNTAGMWIVAAVLLSALLAFSVLLKRRYRQHLAPAGAL